VVVDLPYSLLGLVLLQHAKRKYRLLSTTPATRVNLLTTT